MALSKDEFNWIWKDTSREGILNQFYSDYVFTQKLKEDINKAIEYIETNVKEHMHDDYDITMYYALNQNECDELLKILKGEEQ